MTRARLLFGIIAIIISLYYFEERFWAVKRWYDENNADKLSLLYTPLISLTVGLIILLYKPLKKR